MRDALLKRGHKSLAEFDGFAGQPGMAPQVPTPASIIRAPIGELGATGDCRAKSGQSVGEGRLLIAVTHCLS
jgi:hypothetical protein